MRDIEETEREILVQGQIMKDNILREQFLKEEIDEKDYLFRQDEALSDQRDEEEDRKNDEEEEKEREEHPFP